MLVEGFFTENLREQKTADSIFDASIGKIAIVNVPSAAKRAIDSWFSINDLFGLAESLPTPVKFVRWFVTNGEHNSMNLFVDSINKYSHKMTHVLVKNHHFSDDWNLLEEPVYATAISKALTIDFPTLKESCATEIRGSEMSYERALNGEGYFRNKVVDRHVVKVFIDKFSAIFKQTEQFKNLEELGHNLYDNNLSGFSTSPLSISPENTITANNTVEQVSNEKTNARYTATKSQKSSKSSK
ncbi:hypothetical protein [Okeania sp. KiyG1]|uniref:hypothetical protein n=1 Tax=Okeania sp. KiyG1 TaxID=2720165 RepID=UPI0019245692|nr:hypothetical protein [Okeania sp. KiyG1]GGA57236.1 hypothetical protein CYANOKiyG1_78270 [Okeania sp. KiyG1]